MDTIKSKLAYLDIMLKDFQGSSLNKRLLMLIMYWKIFDKINIPDEVMKEIVSKASNPQTLMRRMQELTHETRPIKNIIDKE